MKIVITKVQTTANKVALFCKRPVKAYQTWQFSEGRLLNYFNKKGIYAHPQYISKEQFLKPLLNAMEINSVCDAKKLARTLKKLGIKDVLVEHDVDLSRNVMGKMRLWYYLDKFIDEGQTPEKMIIRGHVSPKCFIDHGTKTLFMSQIEGLDTAIYKGGLEDLLLNLKMLKL